MRRIAPIAAQYWRANADFGSRRHEGAGCWPAHVVLSHGRDQADNAARVLAGGVSGAVNRTAKVAAIADAVHRGAPGPVLPGGRPPARQKRPPERPTWRNAMQYGRRFQGVRRHHRGVGSCGSPGGSRRAGHPARSTGARPVVGSCPSDTTHGMNRPDLPDRAHPCVVPGADHDPSRTRAGTRWGTAWWRPQLPPAGPLSGDPPTPAGPSVPGEPTANQRVDIRIIPFQRGGLVVKPPIAGLGCAGSSRGSISGDPGPAPGAPW
jgi:hypothetical protein